jgi:2'-5' RNA ligase
MSHRSSDGELRNVTLVSGSLMGWMDYGHCGKRSARRWRGMKRLAKREFTPHVTMLYAERRVEECPIEPIRWMVNEFVLIHSRNGHTHLARWPLHR